MTFKKFETIQAKTIFLSSPIKRINRCTDCTWPLHYIDYWWMFATLRSFRSLYLKQRTFPCLIYDCQRHDPLNWLWLTIFRMSVIRSMAYVYFVQEHSLYICQKIIGTLVLMSTIIDVWVWATQIWVFLVITTWYEHFMSIYHECNSNDRVSYIILLAW